MKTLILMLATWLISVHNYGQEPKHDPNKPGKYRYQNYLSEKGYNLKNVKVTASESIALIKNVADVSEWFHQNHEMIRNPKGFDIRALSGGMSGNHITLTEWGYGIPADLGFLFELYYDDGTKWTIEPPQAGFYINYTFGGTDGSYFSPESVVDDGSRYDQSLSDKVDKALDELRKYFRVYPLKEQPVPGVDIYEAYRDGWQQQGRRTIVVYNPDRPPYWVPVTVKEMADAHLAYYSLIQKREIDRMILDQLKLEIAELTPEELAAPAYAFHDSHFVLKVNGQRQGYQIMKFNPEYWDRSLPRSAIQFMTFWNQNLTKDELDEQAKRSYPSYPQLFIEGINLSGFAGLIMKGKK